MQAVELFEQTITAAGGCTVAEVSRKSAYEWPQLWRDDGVQALASSGPSGLRVPSLLGGLRPRKWRADST